MITGPVPPVGGRGRRACAVGSRAVHRRTGSRECRPTRLRLHYDRKGIAVYYRTRSIASSVQLLDK